MRELTTEEQEYKEQQLDNIRDMMNNIRKLLVNIQLIIDNLVK